MEVWSVSMCFRQNVSLSLFIHHSSVAKHSVCSSSGWLVKQVSAGFFFSSCTWLCMVPASPGPFFFFVFLVSCLTLSTNCCAASFMFYCDQRLSCFLKKETTHEPKVKPNECVFSFCWRNEHWDPSLNCVRCFGFLTKGTGVFKCAPKQVILFFYWKSALWMSCARVKWSILTL